MKENRFLGLAYLASLFLHLVLVGVFLWAPIPANKPTVARAEEPEIEMILIPQEEIEDLLPQKPPEQYTSIPERQATENPPDDPEFKSLYNSTAADNTEGGQENSPTTEETYEFPQVGIQREQLTANQGVKYTPAPVPNQRAGEESSLQGQDGQEEKLVEAPDKTEGGEWALPGAEKPTGKDETAKETEAEKADQPDLDDWWGGESPSILKEGGEAAAGDRGFDFNQKARGTVGSGVAIDGDFSLNTYEWNYAPWMLRFENELHRHWVAPYAYRLGVISGKTVIKIVIAKDGRPLSMEVLDTEGHQSLHDASAAALKAFAPYAPLPAHFPEENLVITLGLHYPAWR